LALLLFACLFRLDSVPPVWWDEGWTLSVARNWVERGFYGRLLKGEPAPAGLEAAVTVTAPIALSFQVLGVGVWQGRLVGLVFLLGALVSKYFLAKCLYSQRVATFTMAALLIMGVLAEWHPVVMARQVLGEVPMLFYLLTGYLLFYLALSRCLLLMLVAILLWAIAIITKAQALPFWMASLMLPLVLTIYCRRWRLTAVIATGLLSSIATAKLLLWLHDQMLTALPRSEVTGLYEVTALVFDFDSRKRAVLVLLFILPTVFGIYYETRKVVISSLWKRLKTSEETVRLMLLSLVISWLAWYVLLSNSALRYIFPVIFVGSVFLGKFLGDLTDHKVKSNGDLSLNLASVYKRIFSRRFAAKLFIATSSVATLTMLYSFYFAPPDQSFTKVINFLNTRTPPKALIESYESEILFLTDRPYHYPPDQVHVDLIRRSFSSAEYAQIAYNPLAADPDYLVVGPQAKRWNLYGPVLQTGAFRMVASSKLYNIYERVRNRGTGGSTR